MVAREFGASSLPEEMFFGPTPDVMTLRFFLHVLASNRAWAALFYDMIFVFSATVQT